VASSIVRHQAEDDQDLLQEYERISRQVRKTKDSTPQVVWSIKMLFRSKRAREAVLVALHRGQRVERAQAVESGAAQCAADRGSG